MENILRHKISKPDKKLTGPEYLRSDDKYWRDRLAALGLLTVLALPAKVSEIALKGELNPDDTPTFTQERFGSKMEDPIKLQKLRTMPGKVRNTASRNGWRDDRAGPRAKIVRGLHLDEVPQLFSVLKDKDDPDRMAIVGPRPLTLGEVKRDILGDSSISDKLKQQWLEARANTVPGLVSPYSIDQHRPGYELDPTAMMRAEIAYVETASARTERRILYQTMGAVASGAVLQAYGSLYDKLVGKVAKGGQIAQFYNIPDMDIASSDIAA